MEPLSTFCFAAIVFLSLPLPLFASAALGTCPSARRLIVPWVWGNTLSAAVFGLAIIATPLPAGIALAATSAIFLFCGMQMFLQLARAASFKASTE